MRCVRLTIVVLMGCVVPLAAETAIGDWGHQ